MNAVFLRRGAVAFCLLLAFQARAQFAVGHGPNEPLTGNQPVTFQADRVNYDKEHGIVVAEGHVEAWQNDHLLRADRITFDRNTNVAAASGHVVIVEPDGEIVFADYAELTEGMKNGIMKSMRALLAQNGKLAGNGARRIEGKLNVLARGVYSTCNLCKTDPFAPPLWQFRADQITQDLEHKRIEYRNMWLDFDGWPVFWLPYFSNSDPSVQRQSGFLFPSVAASDTHLGSYFALPYYWVIDKSSDVVLTPLVASNGSAQLSADYRLDLNEGQIRAVGALAWDDGYHPNPPISPPDNASVQGYLFGHANFNWNDTWRYGADVNVASSINYLRDFSIPGYAFNFLQSDAYVEGFGVGAYTRLSALAYQGVNSAVQQSQLPYVLPRYQYDFLSTQDPLGGRTSVDVEFANIYRSQGASDARAGLRLAWNRPFAGALGDQWLLTVQTEASGYAADLGQASDPPTQQPNYGPGGAVQTGHAEPQVALRLNWPFLRDTTGTPGSWGSQIVEPIAQVIAGPQAGNSTRARIPNEDSLGYEFTDSTLFSLNRFGGFDRFDGGVRVNYALHGSWTFPGGETLDALIGQSYRQHIDYNLYPQFQPWNGFNKNAHLSDIVARASFVPDTWFDLSARMRVDKDTGNVRFADAVGSVGHPWLRFSAGYLYTPYDPYLLYTFDYLQPGALTPRNPFNGGFFVPRNEGSLGVSTHLGHWTLSANTVQNLESGNPVSTGFEGKYEDECFIFDILYARRYTTLNNDSGARTLLFTINFKSVGAVSFK